MCFWGVVLKVEINARAKSANLKKELKKNICGEVCFNFI